MVHLSLARGWDLEVERGPDWLFVHPRRYGKNASPRPFLAEHVWALMEQNFKYRLVLEMGDIERLDNYLISQLVWLRQRILQNDGMMRICGLSSENQKLLLSSNLDEQFAPFRDREDAVMSSSRLLKPR